jgi:hypothetical protein
VEVKHIARFADNSKGIEQRRAAVAHVDFVEADADYNASVSRALLQRIQISPV